MYAREDTAVNGRHVSFSSRSILHFDGCCTSRSFYEPTHDYVACKLFVLCAVRDLAVLILLSTGPAWWRWKIFNAHVVFVRPLFELFCVRSKITTAFEGESGFPLGSLGGDGF